MVKETKAGYSPFISVVMPAYNAGPFIGEVIATVVGQTFTDFELIIIDDGSTDNTADIIKSYAKIDSRISYYYQENQGSKNLGRTINTAVSYAKADWIARADSDDPWYLDKLEKQVSFINKNPDHILIGGTADIINERGEFMYNLLGPIGDDDNRRSLTLYTTLAHGSVVFKKDPFDKVGGYRNIHAVEDLDLWQRMSGLGKIHNLPEPIFKYRQNTQGISINNRSHQSKAVKEMGINFFKQKQPAPLSRNEVRGKLNAINALRGKHVTPDHLVDHLLIKLVSDNIRISHLHIQYGDKKTGYKQLLSIASTGRLGLKSVLGAIKESLVFKIGRVWKKTS